MQTGFALKNRDEVVTFEKLLIDYAQSRTSTAFSDSHVFIVKAFDYLQAREDRTKVFTSILDLQINYILLECDHVGYLRLWNSYFAVIPLRTGSILDSQNNFFKKLDAHRHITAFVLRYRALWDKILGFIILYYRPQDYERFYRSKSKKKAFKHIASKAPQILPEIIEQIDYLLTDFDDTFRTSEAHGTGSLRKSTLMMESIFLNDQIKLPMFFNYFNSMILKIGKLFQRLNEGDIPNLEPFQIDPLPMYEMPRK